MESSLEVYQENIRFTLSHLLGTLKEVRHIELEAVTVQEISTRYRRLAICSLLLEADTTGFFRLLSCSAQAYLSLLRKVDWPSIEAPYYLCASRASPFFDALAASEPDTASELARRSATSWMREDEYEEDFLYMRFLMELALEGRSPQRVAEMLQRLQKAGADREPERVGVCEALFASDSTAFDLAMERLERKRREEVSLQQKNPGAVPQMLSTEPYVFIEGLALVRLADRLGIQTLCQYPGIPAIAMTTPKGPRPDAQAWRTMS